MKDCTFFLIHLNSENKILLCCINCSNEHCYDDSTAFYFKKVFFRITNCISQHINKCCIQDEVKSIHIASIHTSVDMILFELHVILATSTLSIRIILPQQKLKIHPNLLWPSQVTDKYEVVVDLQNLALWLILQFQMKDQY